MKLSSHSARVERCPRAREKWTERCCPVWSLLWDRRTRSPLGFHLSHFTRIGRTGIRFEILMNLVSCLHVVVLESIKIRQIDMSTWHGGIAEAQRLLQRLSSRFTTVQLKIRNPQ